MPDSTKPKRRTKCEIYSRVVGYLRPVQQWNDGKREEFNDRKVFNEKVSIESPKQRCK